VLKTSVHLNGQARGPPTAELEPVMNRPSASHGPTSPAPSIAHDRARAEALDGHLHALAAPGWGGLSPITLALASLDWALHLATQPARASQLATQAWAAAADATRDAWTQARAPAEFSERPDDQRYQADAWRSGPAAWSARLHLAAERWWRDATQLRGMNAHHQDVVGVFARQWLDLLSPANAGLANPEVLERTLASGGANLQDGARHALDAWRVRQGLPPQAQPEHRFEPGHDVAVTPGRVVHRNALVELIQYAPATSRVHPEPLLIVPSWIMKYYILDLSPHNSLVRWLVAQGHTGLHAVLAQPRRRGRRTDDGRLPAERRVRRPGAIGRHGPKAPVHADGLLPGRHAAGHRRGRAGVVAIGRRRQLPALASLSLLAAQTDFSEPGELGLFIDESQVGYLDEITREPGLPERRADGRLLPVPALARPGLDGAACAST
jgi:polyhydroxyalkanoate synthase